MNTSMASTKRTGSWITGKASDYHRRSGVIRRVLLFCGILTSLLYIGMLIFVPMGYPGYNTFSQTVSELSAIGAPTRQLWNILGIPFLVFELAFGFGVWISANQSRPFA